MGEPNKFDVMMNDYCSNKGWCGGYVDGQALHVSQFIPEEGQISADQFVTWLMVAEGYNPNDAVKKKELITVFMKHMGKYKVDASSLKSV